MTSVDRISDEAGFSKGAFYSNFTSKEEIFLELLDTHSREDVSQLTALLQGVEDPGRLVTLISEWAGSKVNDPSWGVLALEVFRRAQRDGTYGTRHRTLFRDQWVFLGRIIVSRFAEGKAPAEPEVVGGLIFELIYGGSSRFREPARMTKMIRLALTSMFIAYGAMPADGVSAREPSGRRPAEDKRGAHSSRTRRSSSGPG